MINGFQTTDLRLIYGSDALCKLPDILTEYNYKSIIMIIDGNILKCNFVAGLIDNIKKGKIDILKVFEASAIEEPSYDYLDEVTSSLKGFVVDCIIGIGGGSICDLAKGVAILFNNAGKGINYKGMNKVKNPARPVILVPTTAGTGTEATKTAVFIDKNEKVKLGINGKNVDTYMAILDPAVLVDCPVKVKIFSGLDAMVHSIEAVTATTSTELSRLIGKQAFKYIFNNFKASLSDKADKITLLNMQLGSYLAGLAMYNAGGGPASGISYPLGVHYKVPHGIAGGIFLQHVFEGNVNKGYFGYNEVYDLLRPMDSGLDESLKSRKFVDLFREFYYGLQAPKYLNVFGITKEDIRNITELTVKQRVLNLRLNPVKFDRCDVEALLEKVIE